MSYAFRTLFGIALVLATITAAANITVEPAMAAALEVVDDCSSDAALDTALANVDAGGTIEFACGEETITLTTTKSIDKAVTIDGGGQITLSGNDVVQLFGVQSGGHLNVQNITLTDGFATTGSTNDFRGGAIYIAGGGEVTIANSAVMSSYAYGTDSLNVERGYGGAIYNRGTLTIMESSFSNNEAFISGGMLYSRTGPVSITDSTIANNQALFGSGGAINIDLGSLLSVTGSTFVSNSALNDGGAIYEYSASAEIVNSTFTNNTAGDEGGAIGLASSSLAITSSTLAANSANSGGAIYQAFSSIDLLANILVNNGGNCAGDPVNSSGYNLTDDTSCGFSATGDIENGTANLRPLADNGGPTQTMLLQEPSDAIDAIPSTDCPTSVDQRGVSRPQLGGCDIGAVELAPAEFDQMALCANRYNGDLRMPRRPNCASTEVLLQLPADGPLNVCVNRYNGDARYSRTGRCASTESLISVIGDGSQSVCVNRYNGDLRVPRRTTCASTEILRWL